MKNRCRKISALLLAALLAAGLIGCGSGSGSTGSEGGAGSAGAPAETQAAEADAPQETEVDEEAAAAGQTAAGETAAQAAPIDYVVRIAQSPSLCQVPLHIAVEKGFFEAEGLTVENVNVDAAHVQEALGAGQVDAAQGLISKYLQPLENGLGVKFVAGVHTGCIKILVSKDSGIQSIEDLRGKKIGVPGLADAAAMVLERSLADAGIRFKQDDEPEVELAVYDKNDLGQALENGAIDGIAVNDPQASQMEAAYDLLVLVDTAADEKYKDEYCCAMVVTDALYEQHPDAAAAFTRAILKASAWVSANQDEAARVALEASYVGGDEEFNASILKTYNYIPSVQGGYDAVVKNVEELTAIGILKEGTDAKAFADGSYAFFDDVPDTYTPEEAAAAIGE